MRKVRTTRLGRGVASIAVLLTGCNLFASCNPCPDDQVCRARDPGGTNIIHTWASGSAVPDLSGPTCLNGVSCTSAAGGLGAEGTFSFCACSIDDKTAMGGGLYQCRANHVTNGAATGHCVYQIKESDTSIVCRPSSKYVCASGNILTCNGTGTGWTGSC